MTNFAYHPLAHPLELPVQKLYVRCMAEQPVYLPPREGATPGTTLAGIFGSALGAVACLRRDSGSCFNGNIADPQCASPAECPVVWLYKPYSAVHRRAFSRPVLLRAPALESMLPVENFTLEVTLWGRQAIAARETTVRVLHEMGQSGLNGVSGNVKFAVQDIETEPALTLAQRLENLPPSRSLLLEFQTPFLHQEKDLRGKRYFHNGQVLPLAGILGNTAYTLTAWDMEDRKFGEALDGKARHSLARDSRDNAYEAAQHIQIMRADLAPADIGKRISRGNRHRYPLQGFVGLTELAGDLASAMPWLLALSLAGGGQQRAAGFGSVRIWFDPDSFRQSDE
ncbi:MAG: hypothetical protein GY862_10280 [Gammaproteobacteria bacterium]|nr:hypothetical protein [Gammaproteobacteria bacterium]